MAAYKQTIAESKLTPSNEPGFKPVPDSTAGGSLQVPADSKFIYEISPAGKDADGNPTKAVIDTDGKISGTNADEIINFQAIALDKDQVIQTGGGNDTFRFSTSEAIKNADVNAIIKFDVGAGAISKDGDFDQVILNGRQQDYVFTERSDGGIKIQYVNGDFHGAAVTFYGADLFTFRQIESKITEDNGHTVVTSGEDLPNVSYTPSELMGLLI